jgi:hypothetical protein
MPIMLLLLLSSTPMPLLLNLVLYGLHMLRVLL